MTRRVLIVDDEPILRRVMARFFDRLGFEPVVAADGLEALEKLSSGSYCLVLCDVRMPALDGAATLREAKRRFDALPPWVFLTGYADRSERSLVDSGARAVLSKPTSLDEFRALLRTLGLSPGC